MTSQKVAYCFTFHLKNSIPMIRRYSMQCWMQLHSLDSQCITMLGEKENHGKERRNKIQFKIDSRHSRLGFFFSFISVLIYINIKKRKLLTKEFNKKVMIWEIIEWNTQILYCSFWWLGCHQSWSKNHSKHCNSTGYRGFSLFQSYQSQVSHD